MSKQRFFIYRSPEAKAQDEKSLTSIYRPNLEIRDRETLVPNPAAPAYKMYAIIDTGLKYLEAWEIVRDLNLTNSAPVRL